jgi:hypothetical protein
MSNKIAVDLPHSLGAAEARRRIAAARIAVAESVVHVEVDLPPMLAFFAKPIEALLAREGGVLLEDKSKAR